MEKRAVHSNKEENDAKSDWMREKSTLLSVIERLEVKKREREKERNGWNVELFS